MPLLLITQDQDTERSFKNHWLHLLEDEDVAIEMIQDITQGLDQVTAGPEVRFDTDLLGIHAQEDLLYIGLHHPVIFPIQDQVTDLLIGETFIMI